MALSWALGEELPGCCSLFEERELAEQLVRAQPYLLEEPLPELVEELVEVRAPLEPAEKATAD